MKRSLRIVIADDEADIRSYFRRLLQRSGHRVVGEAATGRELVELCLAKLPDLVISDQQMPYLSGLEASSEIAGSYSVPVIIVSAHDPPLDLADHTNVAAFLVKPAKLTELQSAIDRVCSVT